MSPAPPPPDAGDPSSLRVFPDEILGEIFLRLDSEADLANASAACTAFLRVVRFLRRNRSLYRQPAAIGFLECEVRTSLHPRSFYHAQPPHRSASAACSFLPDPGSWRVLGATGGRLLLSSNSSYNTSELYEDLVVCDPLHRRYVQIPPIPVDLTSGKSTTRTYHSFIDRIGEGELSVRRVRGVRVYDHKCFFAPTGEEGSSFRVIRMIYERDKLKVSAFVFSSAAGQWRRVTFNGSEYIGLGSTIGVLTSWRYHPQRSPYRASGLFSEVLMLDTHKMVFSVVRTPLVRNHQQHAIVEAGEGKLGFLTISDGMLDLYCKAWQDSGVSAEEWQQEKTIPIPLPDLDRYSISFCGTSDGYLLIQAIPPESAELEETPEILYFTLHVKTIMVERLCMLNKRINVAHLYANFLPPLSLPSV